jgi:hypothetical protein
MVRMERCFDRFGVALPSGVGMQDVANGLLETFGARAYVAMKSTDALKDQLSRCQVGDEVIGIDIDGLFDDLRGDE